MSRVVLCAAVLAALTTAPWSFAQGNRRRAERSEPSVQLPTNPRLWYNSSPLSMESLKGKGVVFYFFEETCPVCSEGWRDVQRLVEQHQDQPILFVAVNSGTSSREVQQYLRRNRVSIPVIHDPTRQFENALGVPQLALGGVTYQLRYVAGDGSSGQAQGLGPAAFANAIRSASKGAEWRVDPAGLPRSLMGPWRSIELGDFDAAARAVNKAADSSNEDVKAGAEKLLEAIKEEASRRGADRQRLARVGRQVAGVQGLRIGRQPLRRIRPAAGRVLQGEGQRAGPRQSRQGRGRGRQAAGPGGRQGLGVEAQACRVALPRDRGRHARRRDARVDGSLRERPRRANEHRRDRGSGAAAWLLFGGSRAARLRPGPRSRGSEHVEDEVVAAVELARARVVVVPALVVDRDPHLGRVPVVEAVGRAVVLAAPVVLGVVHVRVVVEAVPVGVGVGAAERAAVRVLGLGAVGERRQRARPSPRRRTVACGSSCSPPEATARVRRSRDCGRRAPRAAPSKDGIGRPGQPALREKPAPAAQPTAGRPATHRGPKP